MINKNSLNKRRQRIHVDGVNEKHRVKKEPFDTNMLVFNTGCRKSLR